MTTIKPICRYYDYREHNRQGTGLSVVIFLLLFLLLFLPIQFTTAQSNAAGNDVPGSPWERAVEAVQYRRHDEAIPLLRLVLEQQSPMRGEAYRLLAHTLRQTGREKESEDVLRNGLNDPSLVAADRARIAFDLAVLLGGPGGSEKKRLEEADELYTRALQEDGAVSSAYLNRANLRVRLERYSDAVGDYQLYLAVRPRDPQRPEIERMIGLLEEEIQAEEIRRVEEERRAAQEEEMQRIAEEERRQQEEQERQAAQARRQKMVDSVLQSLGSVEDKTESFRLESETIRQYDEEIDILD